jgi:hypothetical protein
MKKKSKAKLKYLIVIPRKILIKISYIIYKINRKLIKKYLCNYLNE